MTGRDFVSIADLTAPEARSLIETAASLKRQNRPQALAGKALALLFEKPSLRTRVSFEVAMRQAGGYAIYLSPTEVGLGVREPVRDVARTLSRYVDAIAARTFSHETIESLAQHALVPVINALSDLEHPCQALADFLTIYEKKGRLKGVVLAFIGDGNNVAHSLILGAALLGVNLRMAHPKGYAPQADVLSRAEELAGESGARLFFTQDPMEAAHKADVVYTDVWTSMGQEAEQEERRRAFAGYQVNATLLSQAAADAIVMHDLPARRDEEITDEAMEGPRSVVFDQAENRLHAQKALLLALLS